MFSNFNLVEQRGGTILWFLIRILHKLIKLVCHQTLPTLLDRLIPYVFGMEELLYLCKCQSNIPDAPLVSSTPLLQLSFPSSNLSVTFGSISSLSM